MKEMQRPKTNSFFLHRKKNRLTQKQTNKQLCYERVRRKGERERERNE